MNERSSNTEISTGMTVPALSCVRALYSLQNIMMLTPAAPTPGRPAAQGSPCQSSASLMIFVTFFAIIAVPRLAAAAHGACRRAAARRRPRGCCCCERGWRGSPTPPARVKRARSSEGPSRRRKDGAVGETFLRG